MDKVQYFGVFLFVIGIVLLPLYGLYLAYPELEEAVLQIPLIIRIGMGLFFAGITVLILSLVRERIIDWKKGR